MLIKYQLKTKTWFACCSWPFRYFNLSIELYIIKIKNIKWFKNNRSKFRIVFVAPDNYLSIYTDFATFAMIGFGRVLNINFFRIIARTWYSVVGLVLCSIATVESRTVRLIVVSSVWFGSPLPTASSTWRILFSRTANGLSIACSLPCKIWWPIIKICIKQNIKKAMIFRQ